jgi:gliding motility-associated-like protein
MKNRLRTLGQFTLPLLFLFCCSQIATAQCSLTGTNFTGTLGNSDYTAASTAFTLNTDCEATLSDPVLSVTGDTGFSAMINGSPQITNAGTVPSGGYMVGNTVTEPDIITFTYQVIVTDMNNSSTSTQTMCIEAEFIDVTPPAFNMAQVPADITVTCNSAIPNAPSLTAMDACDNGSITSSLEQFPQIVNCPLSDMVITRNWIAIDMAGNRDTVSQLITVMGNQPPTFTGTLMNETVDCSNSNFNQWFAQMNAITNNPANSSDDCGIITITSDYNPSQPDTLCGTRTVIWTIADNCGASITASATYTREDNISPTIAGVMPSQTINCEDTPIAAMVTVTDNCDADPELTLTEITIAGDCPFSDTLRRTWIAVDTCGNSAMAMQDIIQEDMSAPTFVMGFEMPQDTLINCEENRDTSVLGNITMADVEDNCDMNLTIAFSETLSITECDSLYERTWEISDACGNMLTHVQTVMSQDTTLPVITFAPADILISCDDSTDPSNTGQLTATDNCTMPPMIVFTDNVISEDSISRIWTINDGCTLAVIYTQNIYITDTIPPEIVGGNSIIIGCDFSDNMADVFKGFILSHGAAFVTDNCTDFPDITWMAFYSGTNITADSTNFADTLNSISCPTPEMGIFVSVDVDFMAFDEAGNSDTMTFSFTITDNMAPVLTDCPTDMIVENDTTVCEAIVTLAMPMITEGCNNIMVIDSTTSATKDIESDVPGDLSVPVNSIQLTFNVPPPPFSATTNTMLRIALINTDIEQPTEFFNIIGEDGTNLGQTLNTPGQAQCTSIMTSVPVTAMQFNNWAFDGVINITLEPNIPSPPTSGTFAINDICGTSRAFGRIVYEGISPSDVTFQYSINQVDTITAAIAPFDATFAQGTSNVEYFFTDCADNISTCLFNITVNDTEAPIIDCPADITMDAEPGLCEATLEIPLFTNISDNCGVTTPTVIAANNNADSLLIFTLNPNLGVQNAENVVINFPTPLQGNATPGSVQLIIEIQGDFNNVAQEIFEIFDQDGNSIGTTAATTANCNVPNDFAINIDAQTFNNWAAAGPVFFNAVSNLNIPPPGTADSGINPCGTLDADNRDSTSYLTAYLQYESVSPDFSIADATTVATTTLTPPLVPQTQTLNVGINTITYAVEDLAGNPSECSFDITVKDNEVPNVNCVPPLFVNINPSGFVRDTIFPNEINMGSSDNCGIISMTVDIAGPLTDVIRCDQIGEVLDITLLITDISGNQDSCMTQIAVQATKPMPTIESNCGSDTLFLFANPPATPGGNNAYQCQWTGPNGFVSFDCDPIILEADQDNIGFYTVTVTGITGCEASRTVQATNNDLPLLKPTIQADDTEVCENTIVNFTTTPVPGNGVSYNWYFGAAPNGFLLATTTTNTYNWLGTSNGFYNFYVETQREFCTSESSDVLTITVKDAPVAQISPDNATICEGETLTFPVVNSTASSSCVWTGPAGFSSNSCSPAPIVAISQSNSGFYNLVLTEDGCESDPVTFTVSVLDRPDTPTMFSNTFPNNPLCEGEELLLSASNIAGAVSYEWESPSLTTFTSSGNSLIIPVATLTQHGGNWRVRAIGNPCISEWSQVHFVNISVRPESVTASVAPNPACEGEAITFSASSATANVSYEWFYPNGTTVVAGQTFDIEEITLSNAGTYTVVVANEFGCSTTTSVALQVNDRPNITGVANNAPNCVLGPVDIQLTTTIFPPNDGTYTFLWTGDGFSSTDSVATIPQATTDDSGPYTLTVTNGDGCSSIVATTTVIVPPVVPTPAAPTTDSTSPFCDGETVVFTTTVGLGNNVTYIWETPQGTITTMNSSLTLDPITIANSGSYTVRIESDGCQSAASGATVIEVQPKPVAIPMSNSPVCEGEALELFVDCMTGTQYEWQGPNGFSSSLCNPVIPNATADLMDEPFRVRILVDGCWSDEALITVNVKEKPKQPFAVNFGPYCSSSQDVTVGVSAASATPGATYVWVVEGTDVALGQATGLTFTIPNAAQYGNGTTSFVVVATLDGCVSENSVATNVEMNTIPANEAEAGPSIVVCDGDIITLQATAPTVGTGLWTLVEGNPMNISIANPDQSTTTAAGFTVGVPYVFEWTLSNGVCENYSSDTTGVFVNIVEFADAGESVSVCNETEVQLNATMPTSNIGIWSQPSGQEILGVNITDPSEPMTTVTGLIPGQSFLFTWTIEGGCGADEETISVTVSNETAFAGSDMESCSIDGCVELSADAASGGGVWATNDPDLEIISPNNPNTTVCGFTPGVTELTWFINDGACGDASLDTIVIDFQMGPIAVDDQISIAFAQETKLQLLSNDQVPENFVVTILDEPVGGTLELEASTGIITYDANASFIGTETITYELCAENCECSTAVITIQVGLDAACTVPNIFTPNNDGINDFFVIPCLADEAKLPNSDMSIFNTWGDEVFGGQPYLNNWEGTFNGEELPAGTYFYMLNLGNGDPIMSGFITLQR